MHNGYFAFQRFVSYKYKYKHANPGYNHIIDVRTRPNRSGMDEHETLPHGWEFLFTTHTMVRLREFERRARHLTLCPRLSMIFRPLYELHPARVQVVIVGQEPYPRQDQASGYAFSIENHVPMTASLKVIFREIQSEYPSFQIPPTGNLQRWVDQGVLLLNASLTAEVGKYANVSHHAFWQPVVMNIIEHLSNKGGVVFMLWGKKSQQLSGWINKSKNLVLESAHPSPRAGNAFFGCNHFRTANEYLCGSIRW